MVRRFVQAICAHAHPSVDSDIISLKLLGTSVIILNSIEAVNDLFEKRSSNYSDRYGHIGSSLLDKLIDMV